MLSEFYNRDLNLELTLKQKLSSGWVIQCFDDVCSTMNLAREAIQIGFNQEHLIILAKSQSLGRGRLGRTWVSNTGGLYGTMVFKFPGSIAKLSGLSLAIGVGIAEIDILVGKVALKWPNDILARESKTKIGGILIETNSQNTETYILVGVGINIDEAPQEIATSCSLREIGVDTNLISLCCELTKNTKAVLATFALQGFTPFIDKWLKYAAFLGDEIKIVDNSLPVFGKFIGIGTFGEMILETKTGIQTIIAGDLEQI